MFNVFLSTLSAALLIVAFPRPGWGLCAWFALIPWLFALRRERPLRAFFLSYLVGLISFAGILYWVNYVSSLGFTVLVLYLGLYLAVFGLLFSRLQNFSLGEQLLLLPCIWVVLEYLRSHLFSGFSWALLGYSQYLVLPVIQISDITGAYGVSFLIVLVNIGVFQVINVFLENRGQKTEDRKRALAVLYICLFFVTAVLAYGYWRLNCRFNGQNIRIAVIQGNIPQEIKWDPRARDNILQKYFYLTKQTAVYQPRLIIWPETSVPGFLENEPALLADVSALSKEVTPSYLLVGAPHQEEESRIYNRATLFSQGNVIQHYDKLHLVPFGEFMPWPGLFSHFSFAQLIGKFNRGENYTLFSLSSKGVKDNFAKSEVSPEIKFGVLICFEDVFAYLARRFVQRGAMFLVNITNDAWFKDSSELYQHLQASVLRAVENRVNVIRSANTGISCFISPWGKILSRVTAWPGKDSLVTGKAVEELSVISMPSFYTKFGDVFAALSLLAALFLAARHAVRKTK